MRITSLHIEGFRSIRSLSIDDLGPLNVFYGPNGAGKSNILAAVELWGRAVDAALKVLTDPETSDSEYIDEIIDSALPIVQDRDRCRYSGAPGISVVATLRLSARDLSRLRTTPPPREAHLRLGYAFPMDQEGPTFSLVGLLDGAEIAIADLWDHLQGGRTESIHSLYSHLRTLTRQHLVYVLPPVRALVDEHSAAEGPPSGAAKATPTPNEIGDLLARGRTKEALTRAVTAPDRTIRTGMKHLRQLLSGEPLQRPDFDPVFDPATGTYDILEHHTAADGQESWVSLDLSGLGIQQIYITLACILFAGSRIIGLEEPEAHLHAPTMGRDLRSLLKRLVDDDHISQLFVATHSNLFDLDTEGYYDVRLDPVQGTVVERRPLSDIDQRHLYEPGPAKHALQDLLRYLPQETAIFRRADGSGVTAPEMLEMLQQDDVVAVEFLRDVVAAAVRAVQIRAKGKAAG